MWSIDGTNARLRSELLCADLDLRHPARGLRGVRVSVGPGAAKSIEEDGILRVTAAGLDESAQQIQDSYVRGNDLIVAYTSSEVGQLSSQVYWRMLEIVPSVAAGVELVVSAQTDVMDADASGWVGSVLSVEGVSSLVNASDKVYQPLTLDASPRHSLESGDYLGLLLYRITGARSSYVEMAHPADFCQASLASDNKAGAWVRSSFRLFPERLEKGVIRRCRLRAVFLPRNGDEHAAASLYRDFVTSDPPLAT